MAGEVSAVVARIGEVNANGLRLEPGALLDRPVLLSLWGHSATAGYGVAGCGRLAEVGQDVVLTGRFDNTLAGRFALQIVRGLGSKCQWSLAVKLLTWLPTQAEGRLVQVVSRAQPFEVSPVIRGACRASRTLSLEGVPIGAPRRMAA